MYEKSVNQIKPCLSLNKTMYIFFKMFIQTSQSVKSETVTQIILFVESLCLVYFNLFLITLILKASQIRIRLLSKN